MKKGSLILLTSIFALAVAISLIFVFWKSPENAQSQLLDVTFSVREDHPNFDGQKFVALANEPLNITKNDFIVVKHYEDREETVQDFQLSKNFSSENLEAGNYSVALTCESWTKWFPVVVNFREIKLSNFDWNQNETIYSGEQQKITILSFTSKENNTIIDKNVLNNIKFSYLHYYSNTDGEFGSVPTDDLSKAGYYKTVAHVDSLGSNIYKLSEEQDEIEHFWEIKKKEIDLDGLVKWGNAETSMTGHYFYQPSADFKMDLSITDPQIAKAFSIKTTIYYNGLAEIQSTGGVITQDLTQVGFYRAEADVELIDKENYICSARHFTQWWQVFSSQISVSNIKLRFPFVNGGTIKLQDIHSQTIDIATMFDDVDNAEIIVDEWRCDDKRIVPGALIKRGYYTISIALRIKESLPFSENAIFTKGRFCSFSFTII